MIKRLLEPEAMESADEVRDYDLMDHAAVNAMFVDDMLAAAATRGDAPPRGELIIDIGVGTARIPITLCLKDARCIVIGIDRSSDLHFHWSDFGSQNGPVRPSESKIDTISSGAGRRDSTVSRFAYQ